jgi:glycosyltransferase involved in cell wall biosynthesis
MLENGSIAPVEPEGQAIPGPRFRLAVVDTNPVQYRVPLWRQIQRDGRIAIKVFYASRLGLEAAKVPGFGESWVWDIPLLDGYEHEFLNSAGLPLLPKPGSDRYPLGLKRRLERGRFDAVLVFGYVSAPALAGMVAGWRTRTPLILRGESHEHGATLSVRKRFKRLLLPPLLRHLDAFLAIGAWNREYWLGLGVPEDKIWVAPYSVDNDCFRQRLVEDPNRSQELRASWGAGPKDVVFLYCAKLSGVKAPEVLVEAFARLLDLPGARLVMVGIGPMEAELKVRAGALGLSRIRWEGFVNQRDLPFYYRAADVFVLPSRFEPWGLVVNEALACGTPCIVSDVVGCGPDLVDARGTGLVFKRDDVDSLESALRQAMNPVARERWRAHIPDAMARACFRENIEVLLQCIAALRRGGEDHGEVFQHP